MDEKEWEAGPALDAAIARSIFAVSREVAWSYAPQYSTDAVAAHEVLEHLRRTGHAVGITTGYGEKWYVSIDDGRRQGDAETLSLAICRAALGMSNGITSYHVPAEGEKIQERPC